MEMPISQDFILERLKKGDRYKFLYWFADNITRANYADFLWPDKSIQFRHHFMFHTPKENNGFSDGKHVSAEHMPHSPFDMSHCCWCGEDRDCSNARTCNR